MRAGVSKEEVERLMQQEKNRHRAFAKQKEDEGGTKMETKLETKKKRVIMNLFDKGRFLFSQMDKFDYWVASRDVAWACILGLSNLTTLKLTPI